MLTTQKTICVIRHDKNKLPILNYLDRRAFTALSLSSGVILWIYRGMSMLISAARIANMADAIENIDKFSLNKTKTRGPKLEFTTDDAIMLPEKIADALLGEDK